MQQLTWPDVIDGVGDWVNPNLRNGLIGAWVPTLGPTGGTLHDVSGMGNDGTLTNMEPGTDWVTSENGWALDFDGVDEYVVADCDISIPFTLFTVCKCNDIINAHHAVSLNNGITEGDQYSLTLQGNVIGDPLRFRCREDGALSDASTSYAYVANRWYTMAGVAESATNRKLYVNGAYGGYATTDLNPVIHKIDLGRFGDSSPTHTQVTIAVALIYSRAITTTEIRHLYLDPLAPFRRRVSVPFGVTATPVATTVTSYFYQHLLAGTSC